jgi:hypothetical protein
MTAIISFLGSAVFRWLLEKIFNITERSQDHKQEMELRSEQERIDSSAHLRNLEIMERQAALNVRLEEVKHQGAMDELDGQGFIESIRSAKPTGNAYIDGWNGSIRPLVATVSLALIVGLLMWLGPDTVAAMTPVQRATLGLTLFDFALNLAASALGWYFGARSLLPGKK